MKYLVIFVFLFGCVASKNKAVEKMNCDTVGTVKDFSGLDGCGFLIELENGDLLNPAIIKGGFEMEDKQVVSFSYVVMEDLMGICMREKYQVEITCIRELGKTPAGADGCVDTENPFEVEWMDKAIDLHNPNQVLKYKDGSGWAYLFRSIPSSYLYNCSGKLICETKNDHDKCQFDHIDRLGNGRVIWQGEGVWD